MVAQEAHMLLAGITRQMNLTSMNGDRLRLSEKFMEAPGSAKPDCLIAAEIANTLKAMYLKDGKPGIWPSASRASTGRPRKMPSMTAFAVRAARALSPSTARG